jgi:serine protease Do
MVECQRVNPCGRVWPMRWVLILLTACSIHSAAADDLTSEQRERLYQELVRDVAVFEQHGNLLKRAVRLVKPTVVHIAARKQPQSSRSHEEAGSGVIVDIRERPYVLTNRHVINDSPLASIDIHLSDGDLLHPTYVWTDKYTDVAVMEVARSGLTPARVGSSEDVEIGDFVLAVGSPFGLSHSVTYGIISAKGRRDLDLGDGSIRYQDFIQTDAAINPGNSGGPLLNLRGEVVGINTAIASSSGGNEGIGFAMPVDMAMAVARQLVEHGRPLRAYLGVRLSRTFSLRQAARLGLTRSSGGHVTSVTPGSPAALANIRTNDVVVEFDGYQIEDDDHLIRIVGFTPIGKIVGLVVFRAGRRISLKVSVVDRSDFDEN